MSKHMLKCFNIILDSDGCIMKTIKKYLSQYNKKYNLNLSEDDVVQYDLSCIRVEGADMMEPFRQEGFFRDLELEEDAEYYIGRLKEDGHNLLVATDTPDEGMKDKKDCFRDNIPILDTYRDIAIVNKKEFLYGDIVLEDSLGNLKKINAKYKFIMDRPWNRESNDFIRVYSWKDFYEKVNLLRYGFKIDAAEEKQAVL